MGSLRQFARMIEHVNGAEPMHPLSVAEDRWEAPPEPALPQMGEPGSAEEDYPLAT